jgi:hypothetical protein
LFEVHPLLNFFILAIFKPSILVFGFTGCLSITKLTVAEAYSVELIELYLSKRIAITQKVRICCF